MTRIACIGNSHLAAFKLGWERINIQHPDIEVEFFGAAASAMRYLAVDGNRLIPTREDTKQQILNTGGKGEISGDYDAYILVGMGIGIVHLVNMYLNHRPAHLYEGKGGHLISDALVDDTRHHLIDRSAAVLNLRRLRKITHAPIYVAPNPFPISDVVDRPGYAAWADPAVLGDCQRYLDGVLEREYCDVTYIEQPEETLASRYLTKPEFTRDAKLLKNTTTRATNPGDPWHLNAEYGAIFLEHILQLHQSTSRISNGSGSILEQVTQSGRA